jgi:hypothetical protein
MRGEALSLQCLAKAVRPVCEGCVCVRARRYFESRIFLYINVHYTIYIDHYRSIVCQLYTVCIQCTVYVLCIFFRGRNVAHKHFEQHDSSKKRTATGWNNHLVQSSSIIHDPVPPGVFYECGE